MPRIAGVDVPAARKLQISLSYIHGIGRALAGEICNKAGIDATVRTKDLTDEEIARVAHVVDEYPTEGNLKRATKESIGRLVTIQCYRGLRHRRGLPVRGQHTRTNARTRKGPKKVVATKKSIKQLR